MIVKNKMVKVKESSINEIVVKKLNSLRKKLSNRKDDISTFIEEDMSEIIGKEIDGFTSDNYYELFTMIFFISNLDKNQKFNLKTYNKLFDNLSKKQWSFYINSILNY